MRYGSPYKWTLWRWFIPQSSIDMSSVPPLVIPDYLLHGPLDETPDAKAEREAAIRSIQAIHERSVQAEQARLRREEEARKQREEEERKQRELAAQKKREAEEAERNRRAEMAEKKR